MRMVEDYEPIATENAIFQTPEVPIAPYFPLPTVPEEAEIAMDCWEEYYSTRETAPLPAFDPVFAADEMGEIEQEMTDAPEPNEPEMALAEMKTPADTMECY